MANKTVRLFSGDLAGETGLTLELINPDTGAVGNGAGDSLTEVANGLFEATVTEAITGWWKAVVKKGAVTYASGGNLYIASDVVGEYLVDDFANNTAVANWSALTVDHTSTGSFGYVIGLFFQLIENVTGWRFTAKALEQAPTGATVSVTPVVAQVPVRVRDTDIETYIGDLSTIRIGIFSGEDAVDLSGFGDLEVCVQAKDGTDLDFVEMADLTIDGTDNNYVSWDPSGPSVATIRRGKWSLRKTSNKQVIAKGAWIISDAALEDTGS